MRKVVVPPEWDFWLIFHDPALEREFWNHRVRNVLLRFDLLAHASGLMQSLTFVLKYGVSRFTWIEFWLALCGFVGVVSFALLTALFNRRFYEWNREQIICAARLFAFVGVTAISRKVEEPPKDILSVAGRFISGTNITTAFYAGLMCILQFKTHCIVAAVQCLAGVVYAGSYCSRWFSQDDTPIFDNIGNTLRHVLLTFGLGPKGTEGATCEAIFSYFMLFFGFGLSSLVMYVMELHSRIEFLIREAPREERKLRKYSRFQTLIAVGFFVVISQVFWVLDEALILKAQNRTVP